MKACLLSVVLLFSFSSYAFILEASGGTKVGSFLVIAGDEDPSSLWIGTDPESVKKTKLNGAKWDDMEGLAAFSDSQFFGVTSHSLTKKGKRKPEREQLILFSMQGNGIISERSWSLRESILSYLKNNLKSFIDFERAGSQTPDEGGLNIEGLAYLNGKIFLGLRSPLTFDGNGIVLEVSKSDTSLSISNHKIFNLGGKGIRSLETDGSKIILLAGSTDDSDRAFSLYQFVPNGRVNDLQQLIVKGFSRLLRPESVIVENERSLVFLQDFQEDVGQDVLVRLER